MVDYKKKIGLLPIGNVIPVKGKNGELIIYNYGKMAKGGLQCSVLIEYDGNKKNYNIYYGLKIVCNAKNSNDNDALSIVKTSWAPVIDELKTAFDAYWNDNYITPRNIKNYNIENSSLFNKECQNFTVWPFWISLSDSSFIDEAERGVKVIIETLLSFGFEYL